MFYYFSAPLRLDTSKLLALSGSSLLFMHQRIISSYNFVQAQAPQVKSDIQQKYEDFVGVLKPMFQELAEVEKDHYAKVSKIAKKTRTELSKIAFSNPSPSPLVKHVDLVRETMQWA